MDLSKPFVLRTTHFTWKQECGGCASGEPQAIEHKQLATAEPAFDLQATVHQRLLFCRDKQDGIATFKITASDERWDIFSMNYGKHVMLSGKGTGPSDRCRPSA